MSTFKYIKDRSVFNLYIITYFALFLQSIHVWFFWGNLFKIICPLLFVCSSILNRKKNPSLYSSNCYSHIIGIIIIISFLSIRGSYDAGILSICKSVVGILALIDVLLLSPKICIYLTKNVTIVFAVITAISLSGWVLFLIGVPLPHALIVDKEFGYVLDNYYIFLYNNSLIPRFGSVFLEPGYYGQLASIILFANKMRINNRYTIIILLGVLFSLSLAGYALVTIGFILTYLRKKYIVYFFIIFALGYVFVEKAKSYSGGENAINTMVLSRMEFEDGEMKAQRTTEDFDRYMNTKFHQNGYTLFGVGSDFEKMHWEGVAGYKVYIAQNGYLGLFLAILAYWLVLFRIPKPKIQMKFFFILIMLLYWQAAYPFWFCYFSIYVIGLAFLQTNNKKILDYKL